MIVDDDFISRHQAEFLENKVFSKTFPWNYSRRTSAPKAYTVHKDEKTTDSFQFVHMFYADDQPRSEFFEDAKDVFFAFIKKHNIEFRSFVRGKCNLVTRPDNLTIPSEKPDVYMYPHVDFPYDHKVFLYYINDSEGDTVFFDKNEDGSLVESSRLSPQRGRAAVFSGSTIHAPGYPYKTMERCVINIVFV